MAVYCQPCKERRATESPATHFPGGTPMCDACFGGRITKLEEKAMPKKIEIDIEKLKTLHAQRLSDREIGERLGCSAATARTNRVALGLGPGAPGRRGHRPSGKASKAGGRAVRHPESRVSSRESRETATIHLSTAALDALWNDLDLDVKAEWIEKILGN